MMYDLHGLRLAVTGWEEAAAALHGRLEGLPSAAAGEPDLVFEIGVGPGAEDGLERPERGRPVYEPPIGEVLFDDAADRIWIGLGPDRRATYSPFLPISPRTGVVLQVPMVARDVKNGTVTYEDPDTGERVTTPVTRGMVKCQWKADWAMRWTALGIDYEMAGKDLIDSVKLSGEICRALGGTPPEGFNYELFLDDKGQKISKSKGNGLTIEEWLRYASPESLSLFMYREPKSAKRLYFDVIPRNVDEYYQFLDGYRRQDDKQKLSNPVWHIHAGEPPKADMPITFQLLLTLVSLGVLLSIARTTEDHRGGRSRAR